MTNCANDIYFLENVLELSLRFNMKDVSKQIMQKCSAKLKVTQLSAQVHMVSDNIDQK